MAPDAGERVGRPGEVYFEFTAIGRALKVTAIDAASGLEVSVLGPVNAPRAQLERLALQKLKGRLAARAA